MSDVSQERITEAMFLTIMGLDRRLTRAVALQRGTRLTAQDLDALAAVGLLAALAQARNVYLTENAKCRSMNKNPTGEENTTSTFRADMMERQPAANGTFSGTIGNYDSGAARTRARKIFG